MTLATFIGKTSNWGGLLTVSEVQSIVIVKGSMVTQRQTLVLATFDQKAAGN